MRQAICALAFVAFAAYTSALCTPDQWEGIETSLGGYVDRGKPGIIKEYIQVHYDAKNKRVAVFLDYVNEDYKNEFQIVVRYKGEEGRVYVVNRKDQSCWHKKTCCPFRKACVPEDAKKLGDFFFGLEGGLKATSYEARKKGMTHVFSVEDKGDFIVPLTESVVGKLGKIDFMQGVGFANISPGIKNESVFDIPELCTQDEERSMVEELTREHYILAL